LTSQSALFRKDTRVPRAHLDQPYRGIYLAAGRPSGLALPPDPLPLLRAGRLRKQWRYVGVYGSELMVCVGRVRVGPVPQEFWAIWDRGERRLSERTTARPGLVELEPGRARVRDGVVEIDLELDEEPGFEVVTPYGRGYAWTRKQGGIAARGHVRVGERAFELDGRAVIDDSAGYPNRHVSWFWSAAVGTATDGRRVAWNLVAGIHDSPMSSERAIWLDGELTEPGPVTFSEDLGAIAFADGARIAFTGESVRERNENRLVFRSYYAQPFGTFSGTLPGGVELQDAYGVMERHIVKW
jgi:hypothetical protein